MSAVMSSLNLSFVAALLVPTMPQAKAAFQANAPVGTGLEWLTIAAVLIPAVFLVALVYWGTQETI
jgi:hypothetical protein